MRLFVLAILLFSMNQVRASDHLDSEYIDHYPELDIGDLFVWTSENSGDPVFMISLNPLTEPGAATDTLRLDPDALYEFKIDTNDDDKADLAYKINVSGSKQEQTVVMRKATGSNAMNNYPMGDIVATGKSSSANGDPRIINGDNGEKLFVGPSQDPFFFNFMSVESPVALDLRFALGNDGLQSDGSADSTFGPTNITAIVLEVPELKDDAFGAWATTSINGEQQDRCGRASVTAIFLPNTPTGRNPTLYPYGDPLKQTYNTTRPQNDRRDYLKPFEYRLGQVQVSEDSISAIGEFYLPDIQGYDPGEKMGYPNGRNLVEDTVYWTLAYINPFMAVTDTSLHLPQTNPQKLRDRFPYVAPTVKP